MIALVYNRMAQRRQAIAVLALIGLLIASYLSLFRLGVIGQLVCTGQGGCEAVQFSPWSRLLGIPVPYIGVTAYSAILTLALAGIRPSHSAAPRIARALLGLGVIALVFAGYNTFVEAFVIHAFCPWCIACALVAVGIFTLALPEARSVYPRTQLRRSQPAPGS